VFINLEMPLITNLLIILNFIGDQIVVLNGHCLRETTHDQAVKWFRDSHTKMDVVISRMIESKLQKGTFPNTLFFIRTR